jgi:hypothetical protein
LFHSQVIQPGRGFSNLPVHQPANCQRNTNRIDQSGKRIKRALPSIGNGLAGKPSSMG